MTRTSILLIALSLALAGASKAALYAQSCAGFHSASLAAGSSDHHGHEWFCRGLPTATGQEDQNNGTDPGEQDHQASLARHARIRPWQDLRFAITTFAKDGWQVYTAPARPHGNSVLWLTGLTAVGGLLYAADQEIYDELKRTERKDGYRWFRKIGEVAAPVGHMGNMNRFYFGALAGGYLLGIQSATLISGQILEAHFLSGGLKNIGGATVGRSRPEAELGARTFGDGTSFPSGHAINIYELAVIFAHHIPFLPIQAACYFVATAVGFQRVTSGAHWPSDVYVAAVLGVVTARTILHQHERRGLTLKPTVHDEGALGLTLNWRF